MPARSRVRGAVLTAIAAAAFIAVAPAAPAIAHESIQSTSPAEGAVVDVSPKEVVLEFTDEVLPLGAIIIVDDADGTDWVDGDVVVDANTVTAALEDGMPDGVYSVRWRAISGDGHPISDIFQIGIGADTVIPTTAPSAPASADPSSAAGDEEKPAPSTDTGSETWLRVGLVAAFGAALALGLVIVGITLGRRRPRSDNSDNSDNSDQSDGSEPSDSPTTSKD